MKIKQIHGHYALTTEGKVLKWIEDSGSLSKWEELNDSSLVLNYRKKLVLGSAPNSAE